MESPITAEMREWIGRSEPPVTVVVTRRAIQQYAAASGQRLARFLRGDEAPPLFHFDLFRAIVPLDGLGPDGLPSDPLVPPLPLKRVVMGGQQVTYHRPIRCGDVLVGVRTLRDIYAKSGSAGPLLFYVIGLEVRTEQGEPVLSETQTRIAR